MLLDIKHDIINNADAFNQMMKKRGHDDITAEHVQVLYTEWLEAKNAFDDVSRELNQLSKNFDPMQKDHAKNISQKRSELSMVASQKHQTLQDYVLHIPNLLHHDAPYGVSDADNIAIHHYGEALPASGRHHEEVLQDAGYIMKDEAVTMSGSRFMCLQGDAAYLERKLINYVMNKCRQDGFLEVSVPVLVKDHALVNTGKLPKFAGDFFTIDAQNSIESRDHTHYQCLIPTGEVSLANLYANKTLQLQDLPIKLMTMTPCFRKEAGSLGRDTKGLIRLHQFNKVEMFAFTAPEDSENMHQHMLKMTQSILEDLQLPYRIISICSGDIGFTAARQFDIEVWMPGQGKYVEVASISNCWNFQSRRMKTKYITDDKCSALVHTLNGTAIASGRIIAALAEHGRDFQALADKLS